MHCIGWLASSQLKSHTKKLSESENNMVAVQLFWPSRHVGWDPNKSLTLTNIIQYIKIYLLLYIFLLYNMFLLLLYHIYA